MRILVPTTVQGRAGICFGCGARLVVPRLGALQENNNITFEPGERISDRYEIEARLGHGGMGVVYRAHDRLIDEQVALKFMRPQLLRTQKGQELFIREAQVARRLRHENIVAVHDVGTTQEGIRYLSMEFLKGQPLRNFLRKHRKDRKFLDVRLAVRIIGQVLSALQYAHRTVVHRDIKPENVMLMPAEHVKVLDFGLAKALDEEALAAQAEPADGKSSRRVVGTMAYASPEQKAHHPIDFRTDIYAVGLVFHELLTLRTPLDEPVEVLDVRNDVSPSLLGVLERALREDRDARWPSAEEFRKNLLEAFDASYRQVSVPFIKTQAQGVVSTEGMVLLEGGSFLMGTNDVPEESPEFEAFTEPFYMDIYLVTTEQYAKFLEATGCAEPKFWRNPQFNGPTQPVVGVTWSDANAYASWVGKQLPTETQWEFAARGRENRKYPWGNIDPDSTRCNFGDFLNMPSNVSMHEDGRTPEGVYDLAGNVYEWTLDLFMPYSHKLEGRKPASREMRRAVRGSSWHSKASELRCTFRKGLFLETQLTTVGFRCVLPVQSG